MPSHARRSTGAPRQRNRYSCLEVPDHLREAEIGVSNPLTLTSHHILQFHLPRDSAESAIVDFVLHPASTSETVTEGAVLYRIECASATEQKTPPKRGLNKRVRKIFYCCNSISPGRQVLLNHASSGP